MSKRLLVLLGAIVVMLSGCSGKVPVTVPVDSDFIKAEVCEYSDDYLLELNTILTLKEVMIPKPSFTRKEYMTLEQHQKERALTMYVLELTNSLRERKSIDHGIKETILNTIRARENQVHLLGCSYVGDKHTNVGMIKFAEEVNKDVKGDSVKPEE